MSCWFLGPLIPLLYHWVADWDISVLVPCVNKEKPALSPLNQGRAVLDGSYTAIPQKGHIA